MTEIIDPPAPHDLDVQLRALALRHRSAAGPGMQLLTYLGGQAESLLDRLPKAAKGQLEAATDLALRSAFAAASASRGTLPDTSDWLTRALTMGAGAAGGFGGLPSALAELPITTTVLLRAIQGSATAHGLDPTTPEGKTACLQVFASAGPFKADDGTDLSFVALRLSLTGQTFQNLVGQIVPRLAPVLGQKLAAQSVPLFGAAAGAATNYVYTRYYQDMAAVQFGLMRLARESGTPLEELTEAMRQHL